MRPDRALSTAEAQGGVGPASLLLPVEVKASSTVSDKDLKGMAEFMALQKCPAGVVVTRDLFERRELEGRPVYLIPVALFLLVAEAGSPARP